VECSTQIRDREINTNGRRQRPLSRIDASAESARRINSNQVIQVLADAMIEHGIPEHIYSNNGPEFVARELRQWLARARAATLYIEPSSPRENGYCESFNSKMLDEFLNGKIFYSLKEARVLAVC